MKFTYISSYLGKSLVQSFSFGAPNNDLKMSVNLTITSLKRTVVLLFAFKIGGELSGGVGKCRHRVCGYEENLSRGRGGLGGKAEDWKDSDHPD